MDVILFAVLMLFYFLLYSGRQERQGNNERPILKVKSYIDFDRQQLLFNHP